MSLSYKSWEAQKTTGHDWTKVEFLDLHLFESNVFHLYAIVLLYPDEHLGIVLKSRGVCLSYLVILDLD